jgi:Leucine-rich repeat (LRR) protein
MADNSVAALPEELAEWKGVEHINVKNNKLVELPPSIFQSFPSIQRLYVGGNLLRTLPEEIGHCTALVALDFSNNQIEALPVALEQCTNLELLHCGCNKIMDVQPEIFAALTKLKELQLYKNKITIVPPEIGNLSCIERISLASNNLKTLPDEIGSCTTLQELYLGNNAKFSNFPASAGHLHRLRELSLRKCPALKQLPNTAMELTSLRELDVRAMKKEVCKIAQEVAEALEAQSCVLRGGVIKKGKPAKKAKEG